MIRLALILCLFAATVYAGSYFVLWVEDHFTASIAAALVTLLATAAVFSIKRWQRAPSKTIQVINPINMTVAFIVIVPTIILSMKLFERLSPIPQPKELFSREQQNAREELDRSFQIYAGLTRVTTSGKPTYELSDSAEVRGRKVEKAVAENEPLSMPLQPGDLDPVRKVMRTAIRYHRRDRVVLTKVGMLANHTQQHDIEAEVKTLLQRTHSR